MKAMKTIYFICQCYGANMDGPDIRFEAYQDVKVRTIKPVKENDASSLLVLENGDKVVVPSEAFREQ